MYNRVTFTRLRITRHILQVDQQSIIIELAFFLSHFISLLGWRHWLKNIRMALSGRYLLDIRTLAIWSAIIDTLF